VGIPSLRRRGRQFRVLDARCRAATAGYFGSETDSDLGEEAEKSGAGSCGGWECLIEYGDRSKDGYTVGLRVLGVEEKYGGAGERRNLTL
jgi:hypothetical protein